MAIQKVHLVPIGTAILGAAAVVAVWVACALSWIGGTAALLHLAISTALLLAALWRRRAPSLGWANAVTVARSALVGVVTGLVVASFVAPVPTPLLVGIAAPALALDAVDGWVARRTGSASELGARFDMEVDAFLLLVLSAYVARTLGAWVLAIGLMRYAFVAAGWALPWLRAQLPPRYWRKVVTAAQGIALTLAALGLVPALAGLLVGVALALLVESFGRDVVWLARRRSGHAACAQREGRRDREHHDADRLDDDGLRHEREVPRLGDAEQADGEREDDREQARDHEQQAQHGRDREQATAQREHPDREHDAGDRVEHEEHAERAPDAVEDEEQMDPARGEKEDRAEDPHGPRNAPAASGHVHTRFRFGPPSAEAFVRDTSARRKEFNRALDGFGAAGGGPAVAGG